MFDWMVERYIHAQAEGSEKRKQTAEAFRAELYDIILNTNLGMELKAAITKTSAPRA